MLSLKDSITHVNGRGGILVYNYHSVDNPLETTGRIVSLGDDWSVTIPHVTPVNDISYSRIGDDFIYIVTREYVIVYDLQASSFEYFEVGTVSGGRRSNVRMSGSQFGWLCFDDEGAVVFYRVQFK